MKPTANMTESRESRKTEQLLLRLRSLLWAAFQCPSGYFPITRLTAFVWDVMLSAVSRETLEKRRSAESGANLDTPTGAGMCRWFLFFFGKSQIIFI